MLFLVSGASGVGKSTVRELVTPRLGDAFEIVELGDLGSLEHVTLARRQELTEVAARRAAALATLGRHLLLCGDPVAPAEAIAAPSAKTVGGVAVCVLDADAPTQTRRLAQRGDDPALLPQHIGFAGWMREHAVDPRPRLEVLRSAGWPGMHWERLDTIAAHDPRWRVRLIDTSGRDRDGVATEVVRWIENALSDERLVMRPEEWT